MCLQYKNARKRTEYPFLFHSCLILSGHISTGENRHTHIQTGNRVKPSEGFDCLCRNSGDNRIGRHIPRDDGACGDDGIVSDRHILQDRGMRTDPDIFADDDRSGQGGGTPVRFQRVIEGRQYHLMTDQTAVPDRNAALILKTAA